jgi:hypothetical protein
MRGNGLSSLRYRVEHRDRGECRMLGHAEGVFPHHSTLAPYVACLLLDGASGEVALVDEATDAVVARRILRHRQRRGAM